MGGTLGAHLVRAGQAVRFVDTDPAHVAAMNERGLRITGPVADFRVEARAMLPADVDAPLDIVLLAVKAHHTRDAVASLAPHLSSDGVVVSVQNGLNEPVIAAMVGEARTFGCFVNFGADYTGPGVIHWGGRGTIAVGEVDGRESERARAIHALLLALDERAILTRNVNGYLWSKLAYAAMLFATALGTDGIADALDRPAHRPIYAALAREVVCVATAQGVRLESFDGFQPHAYAADATARMTTASLDALVAHNRRSAKTHSGIWRDLAVRHRPTEVDAQLGPVVEAGTRLGIATPLNARLITMIHEIERGERTQDMTNLDALGASNVA